jgi:hypothetical protein
MLSSNIPDMKPKAENAFPDKLLADDKKELRKTIHRLTEALIGPCHHCVAICSDPNHPAPIYCKKHDQNSPAMVDIEACLACKLYK